MDRLRVGVVGTGWVATARHLPALTRDPRVVVEGVCDRNEERARQVAARFGVATYADMDAVGAAGLDAVFVATSPWSHAEVTVAALDAGSHVFCEKPMAMDESEAQAMVRAAESSGRLLCVSHNFLFSRSVDRARRLLGGEQASYVMGLQLSSLKRRLPSWHASLPGGLLQDESPHLLYLLSHFCGWPLTLDHARATGPMKGQIPSTVELLVRGPVCAGQITMSFDSAVSEWHVGIVTRSRVVGLDLFRDICTGIGPDGTHRASDIARTSARVVADHVAGFATSGANLALGRQFWGHDVLISRFVEACRAGGPSPVDPRVAMSIVTLTDRLLDDIGLVRH
jgi:predicted dehydrogenase